MSPQRDSTRTSVGCSETSSANSRRPRASSSPRTRPRTWRRSSTRSCSWTGVRCASRDRSLRSSPPRPRTPLPDGSRKRRTPASCAGRSDHALARATAYLRRGVGAAPRLRMDVVLLPSA
ncbi:hypothetical protein ACFWZ2_37595 [Streptomyces sp. NPDC059002]|uniref:hypothetical protein n=1 Tax=Streptomyces sp. NPDC059002 TaxID=3346690 RepID=UPI0036A9218F